MASAYSTPKQFDNYVAPVNLELVNFVLQSKEQKFNYNIAKVEQTLADFGNLGLVRDEDKEYLADRINTMVSSMGDLENADWSDSNIERQISTGIKGAIDDKVRKDVALSRQYTGYLKQVQELKEKNPDQYSDINFAMGLKYSGADKWIKGEAEEFGNLQYMPKVDYMKQMNEVVSGYVKTHGKKEVERIPNGDGTFTVIEKEVLRPETIRNLWQANMTPEMQRQMQMEADYMYGGIPEAQQAEMVNAYKDNVVLEQNQVNKELDRYKLLAKGTSGQEKALIQEQIAALENRSIQLKQEAENDIPFQQAYMNMHFKGTREKLVEANAFERQTDVELDYEAIKLLKLKRDMLRDDNKAKTDAEVTAASFSKVSDPFIAADKAALTVFERTEEGITSSIDGYVNVMGQNPNFLKSYGISLEAFNNKSPEEKREFAAAKMQQFMDNKIDLASKGFTTEEIKLASKYSSNKAIFEEVNTEISSATNTVAKTTFSSMQDGVRRGAIQIDNFDNKHIREAVKSGKTFDQLSPDMKNAFRVAMIDESLRRANVDDNLKPYLLKQRDDLFAKIKSEEIKGGFAPVEDIERGYLELAGEAIVQTVKAGWQLHPFNLFGGNYGRGAKESWDRQTDLGKEISERLDTFGEDSDIRQLDNNTFGDPDFIVDGKAVKASDYISSMYSGVSTRAETIALQAAPKLTSTSALIINPNVKEQEPMFNAASDYLAAHNSASVQDFKGSEMYMRLDPESQTVVFSAKLSRQAAKDYSGGDLPENRMINTEPIPLSEIQNMGAITDRLKTEQDEWALDSSNKYAQNLSFTTAGFATPEQRGEAIQTALSKLPSPEAAIALQQNPQSLGLTHTEMESYLEDAQRETKSGEVRTFQQEFPNAYRALTSGAGKFEVTYESRHNQGYFASVNYSMEDRTIPVQPAQFTGQRKLNPDRAYIAAYQAQTKQFLALLEGYMQGNPHAINTLKEIDKING